MPAHDHVHRRHARAAFPDPKAIASAFADPFPGPNPFADPEPAPKPAQTLVSVVYVTAEPTFDGPIGGYKTLGVDEPEPTRQARPSNEEKKTTAAPEPTRTREKDNSEDSSIVADTSKPKATPKKTTLETSTGLPTAISSPTTELPSSLSVLAATGSISTTQTSSRSTATVASSESTSSAQPTAEGMSAGGKAGLAIGILLLIGAILAMVLFIFKRKKDAAKREKLEDEKAAMFVGAGRAASIRTNATAPRLSLRPVTQFLPNLGEKRQSRGNALMTAAGPTAAPRRNAPPSQESNRDNPFGNHAEAIDATNANGPAAVQVTSPTGEIIVAAGAGAAAGAAAGLARGASKRGNGPKPMDFTTKGGVFMGPPSPAGTEFSQASDSTATPTQTGTGAAIAAAGGPANTAVHRVQLDFKPSMDDELELRAGQLIRLLHEYDDGWALCIRLDRSQQGVVPRTCLSTRPVKPRPQQQGPRGPPQGQRGPQGQMRPMSPGMNGPPRGQPGMNQGPRPASPSGRNSPGPQYSAQQPMTPQGQGQGRPQSPSGAQQQARRNSPPGRSPMNPVVQADGAGSPPMSSSPPVNFGAPVGRKPVPGQAL